ncbi:MULTISPECIES: membrane protein insertase YidC [Zoogloea]|jgi:YidC/Oxa1 family membrane protein insertase|uniref:Membrane protein insertase YidC n=1 Tax=Zoogloea oleivorans TaxID=1552750 RepID=A0A6C2CXG3_9RHOO|nr:MULTISPECIES: membrane protein insertase YidC [Zoogloea]MBP6800504.1 membrane protein insertase YidC [Zoogloea sp.]MDD2670478.1 membrane protein insertase YidC [Zoogloea sp.]MDY0037583.1 membrane protein insertase YidC [Zoogloea oleivorans]TYC58456.1 membrane protein insertase YidC [Zoogloea oleivorans]
MDNRRLLLLLVFSFSLVMLWDGWQKHNQPKVPASAAAANSTAGVPTPTAGTPGAVALPGGPVAAAAVSAPLATIRTDVLVAEVSAQGGDIVRLELTKHKSTEDQTRNYVLFDNGEKHNYAAQTGLIGTGLPNHKTPFTLAATAVELKDGEDAVTLRLDAAPTADGVKVTKLITFHRGSYMAEVSYEIANGSAAALAPHAYFQFTRDGQPAEQPGGFGVQTFTGPAFYTEAEKYQKVAFEDIASKKAKFVTKTSDGWAAMVQHYFVAGWAPKEGEREFFANQVSSDLYSAGVILPVASIAPGQTGKLSVPLYAGPQEQSRLEQFAKGFDLVVDYGFLTIIAAPLFWVLEWFHKLTGNWGWAIILVTVALKALFFPLSAASYKSMAKMKTLGPRLQRLKEQCGDDKMKLQQAMMDLYKREKVNPLGGCLPILIQIPVFISLYWVLLGVVEMRGAPWLGWIQDLSVKDPYYILPLIMGATSLIQTRLNPAPPDPIQAKVMMMMPVLFTVMFLWFPSGLVLYWVVNNTLSIAQQWQINRMIAAGGKPAE